MHNSSEIRNFIINELKKYDIKKYSFKKSYNEIQDIKKQILSEHKDKIEWLEIENKGTKYIIKLELRELKKEEKEEIKDIVSKKDAIIKKIIVTKGNSLVNVNDYVKKGDILISGDIKLNDEVKGYINPKGDIYGEVWYEVNIEYPLHYKEIKETGNNKSIYVIKFLNNNLELTFNKFKTKNIEEYSIINYYPFSLVKQKQRQTIIIDEIYTKEEAINKAILKARSEIESKLDKDEYIIYQKTLLINMKDSKIILDIFFSVYENITS